MSLVTTVTSIAQDATLKAVFSAITELTEICLFYFTSGVILHVFVCMFVVLIYLIIDRRQETGSHHTAPCRYWPHVAGRRKCGHLLGVAMCPHLAANYTNNALHSAVSTVCITDTGNNTSRGHVLLHVYIIYIITSTLHQTPDTRGNHSSVNNFNTMQLCT